MPPLVLTRLKGFQPICAFLYPRSCFIPKTARANALQISTVRPYTRPSRTQRFSSPNLNSGNETYNHRCFTTSTTKALPGGAMFKPPKIAMPPTKAYKAQVKEQISKNGWPDDIGLFENTLIMPTGKSKPGIFSQPRLRRCLEWYRFKARLVDFGRLIIYKFSMGKPRPELGLRRTAGIAKALHAKTFRAFAEGDTATLGSICTSGLRHHFARQIAARPPGTKYVWTVHQYFGRPRVVSNKAAIIAQGETSTGQRQAVVKIQSMQSLTKVKTEDEQAESKAISTKDQQRKCEYFVIQQRHVEHIGPGEWQVWGTLSEKGWEEILERAGYEQVLNAAKGHNVAGIAGK